MPTVTYHNLVSCSFFSASGCASDRVVDVQGPATDHSETFPSSYLTACFVSGAALFSPYDWVVCQSRACVHVFSQSSPCIHSSLIWLRDISTLWSILYSPPLIDYIMVNGAAMKVWPVRQEEFMISEFYLCLKMSCFYVCVISIYTKCLIYILSVCVCVCVCVCVLQSAGSVSVPPDTGLRPTCFWGREDKREINCSTSSPASALLLREQFVGWHTRDGMKGGGHSNDLAFLGDPVIQQWFPAVDLGWSSCPPPK